MPQPQHCILCEFILSSSTWSLLCDIISKVPETVLYHPCTNSVAPMKKWLSSLDKRKCLVENCYVKLHLIFFFRVISNKVAAGVVKSPGISYATVLLYSTSRGEDAGRQSKVHPWRVWKQGRKQTDIVRARGYTDTHTEAQIVL